MIKWRQWSTNLRFYILCFSLILSVLVFSVYRIIVPSDTLYLIRVQQFFGFTAFLYLYISLLATPMKTIFGDNGFMKHYLHARRALGVSSAYFAILHMLTGVFGQLSGFSGILLLPRQFQIAIIFGFIALLILVLLAATSFDVAVQKLTFPRWKLLHRFVYLAGVLIVLHIWIIGTHLVYSWVRYGLFIAILILALLESYRTARKVFKKDKPKSTKVLTLTTALFLTVTGLMVTIVLIPSYNDQHDSILGGH